MEELFLISHPLPNFFTQRLKNYNQGLNY